MIRTVSVSDLKPNPFRGMEMYPLNETKIVELMDSIEETGFWANVYARPVGDEYEIAYGHHRWEAARRLKIKEVPLIVEPMDDERMFAMMLRENSEAFASSPAVDAGAVAGLLNGVLDGRLKLRAIDPKTPKHAIYLVRRDGRKKLQIIGPGGKEVEEGMSLRSAGTSFFTTLSLADRLGWLNKGGHSISGIQSSKRFSLAFGVLTHLIIPGTATASELKDMNKNETETLVNVARRASNQSPSVARKEVAKARAEIKDERRVKKQSKEIERSAKSERPQKPKRTPELEKYLADVLREIRDFRNPYNPIYLSAAKLIPYIEYMTKEQTDSLSDALGDMLKRNAALIEKLMERLDSRSRKEPAITTETVEKKLKLLA